MNEQPKKRPLQDIAENAHAYETYVKSIDSAYLDTVKKLEALLHEVRVHCRTQHVAGDKKFHRLLRSRPVEKALAKAIKDLKNGTEGLEKAAYERHAYEDKRTAVAQERHDKAIAKAQKKNQAALNYPTESIQQTPPVPNSQPQGYSDQAPTSITDLGKWRSAS